MTDIYEKHIQFIVIFIFTGPSLCQNSPPFIVNEPTVLSVSEGIAIGDVIFTLQASDYDPNSQIIFKMETDDTRSLVQLSPVDESTLTSGQKLWSTNVTLREKLDRDHSPQLRKLYFTVSDGQNEVAANRHLIITDVNDNAPSFIGLPYRTTVPENETVGAVVFTLNATDPDSGQGGVIKYQLQANSDIDDTEYKQTFSLTDRNNVGYIALTKPLDYETRSFYHFKVYVKDNGRAPCPGDSCVCDSSVDVCNSDPVDLFITVLDVQDTPPVFENLPYITTVPEDQNVGSSIYQVKAVDGDRAAEVTNNIEYTFSDGDHSNFGIDANTGIIRIAATLDVDSPAARNKGGFYLFTVQAAEVAPDGSIPVVVNDSIRISQTQMSITVTDVNDMPPMFIGDPYVATVQENTPQGVPLTLHSNIAVADLDQGLNSRFRIFIEKDGQPYWDFSTLPNENQTIQGTTTITVMVMNSSVLDYETRKYLTFTIVAREINDDVSTPASSIASVQVTIEDANDNSPQFNITTLPVHFDVSEDANISHVIGTIKATDVDSGDFGQISYSLEDSGQNSDFAINSLGEISVSVKLDRETRSTYSIAVIATDSPSAPESQRRRNRLPVQIRVTDVNDFSPEWIQVIPQVSIMESEAVGTSVTDLRATDKDEGRNAQVTYNISPGTNGSVLFSVKEVNGTAVVEIEKSLIGHPGIQLVTIVATDQGDIPRSSSVNIYVQVVDMNLHRPKFIHPNESVFTAGVLPEIVVEEEMSPGTPLTQLIAEDKDLGENGKVWYYLLPSVNKDFEYFRLDRLNGSLTSDKRLDREVKEVYEIQVEARDNGNPASLSTSLTMKVRLIDIDDNLPSYSDVKMPQSMNVREESDNTVVGQVLKAIDKDSEPENTVICYYLYGGEDISYFDLDKSTGKLTVKKKIDRETTQYLDLVIKASSNCTLSETSSTTAQPSKDSALLDFSTPPASFNTSDHTLLWIRIYVDDINDNPPVFVEDALSRGLIFDKEIGTEVLSLQTSVTDADETPPNSVHQFSIVEIIPHLEDTQGLDNSRPPFVISPNGTVLTNMIFRPDMVGYFILIVKVLDQDGLGDTTEIRIYLVSNLQRVKLIFNRLPNEVELIKDDFTREMSEILQVDLFIDRIMTHTRNDGTRDAAKTDAFIHGRYKDTEEVVPAPELWRAFDFNQAARAVLYKYKVDETQELVASSSSDSSNDMERVLAIIIAVMSVILISLIVVLIHLVRMYRRRLRAATTMAYVSPKEQEMYEHPGTNKYYAAANPLFGKEIKPVDVEEDKTSHNSLDVNMVDDPLPSAPPKFADEEQEMVLTITDSPDTMNADSEQNQSTKLNQVLAAYDNPGFDLEETGDVGGNSSASNGYVKGLDYSKGGFFIPGIHGNVQEAVTRFSDDVLSKDSGYPEGSYNQSHLQHSDI